MQIAIIHSDAEKSLQITELLKSAVSATIKSYSAGELAMEFLEKTSASKEAISVLKKANHQDAISKLRKDAEVDLVIIEDSVANQQVLRFEAENIHKTPIILITQDAKSDFVYKEHLDIAAQVDATKIETDLVKKVESWIQSLNQEQQSVDANFCPIHTKLLVRVAPLKGDIYIRLSAVKYLKLFRKGDRFDKEDLERFLHQKKIEYLYLHINQTDEFLEKLRSDIRSVSSDEKIDKDRAIALVENTHTTVQEMISRVGFTREVQLIAKQSVDLAVKTIGKNPKLKSVLKWISRSPQDYNANHSMLLATVSCCLAADLSWFSRNTYLKLVIASFFHDISLKNSSLSAISTLDELDKAGEKFSEQERHAYKLHPNAAADVVKSFHEIPPDVDTVILQHHERPDGTGFPRGLNHLRLGPLSCVFIISHDLVQDIIAKGEFFELKDYMKEARKKYDVGNFKRVIKSLKISRLLS